ncbi:MAG: glycosyltransferase family 2 protein [Candidatus Atribacteria bacterium]|nr:glycosyltransferase family 2 protein [Candidatus Atribacteria bacterium]
MPSVDVVIATIGRPSLEMAMVSACLQTAECRCVVVADGPNAEAREIFDRVQCTRRRTQPVYLETPTRLGRGELVHIWYAGQTGAADWLKFLNDDDVLLPQAIELMAGKVADGVTLVTCQMLVNYWRDGHCRSRIAKGALQPGDIGIGNAMVRTADYRRITYRPDVPDADVYRLQELAAMGDVRAVPQPLYVYNAWRTNAHRGYK